MFMLSVLFVNLKKQSLNLKVKTENYKTTNY